MTFLSVVAMIILLRWLAMLGLASVGETLGLSSTTLLAAWITRRAVDSNIVRPFIPLTR
jgi:hypothetical protein